MNSTLRQSSLCVPLATLSVVTVRLNRLPLAAPSSACSHLALAGSSECGGNGPRGAQAQVPSPLRILPRAPVSGLPGEAQVAPEPTRNSLRWVPE